MLNAKVQTLETLENVQIPPGAFLLYDRKLQKKVPSFIGKFSQTLAVTAGESLKDIENFAPLVKKIMARWKTLNRRSPLYVMGGGSLGDCGGFVASCLKRGVPLIHIPTTWLSAVDSAHGGKNALNVQGQKNQVGSFYAAQKVILVKSILEKNPKALAVDAFGEVVKMGLIAPAPLFSKMCRSSKRESQWLRQFLKPSIAEKQLWVERDPFETKGLRQVLNFGHSFGHVLEAERGLGHGTAVLQGIFFACAWSRHKKILSEKKYADLLEVLQSRFQKQPLVLSKGFQPLPLKKCQHLLLADKKALAGEKIKFVFLKEPGRPLIKDVSVNECLAFAQEEGWVR